MDSTQSINKTREQSSLLKNALRGNALFSGLSGIVAFLGAQGLATFTGIETPWVLTILGVILMIFAVDLWWVSSREPIDRRFAWAAIFLDILWVVGSTVILLTGWLSLTTAGRWTVYRKKQRG